MVWRRPGDKPLSGPMLVNLLTHIYASLGLNELEVFEGIKAWNATDLAIQMRQALFRQQYF